MDSSSRVSKPFSSPTPQTGLRRVRRSLAYATLIELCVEGEGLAQATARCTRMGARTEAETLVALNSGLMGAPKMTSDGVAAALRFAVECADYIVEMTPDPRHPARLDRPIPADGIRRALKDAGYSVLGQTRTTEGATHQTLAERTGIPRRTIGRICSGERNDLTETEADAILVAIDRVDTDGELIRSWVERAARRAHAIEEQLDEIYEYFWICRAFSGDDERDALQDLDALRRAGQLNAETIRLPPTEKQGVAIERFRTAYGRDPRPVPDSLRTRALNALTHRHNDALAAAATARREIGPPEKVNAASARDLVRRVRQRGLLEPTQRPVAFNHDRDQAKTPATRNATALDRRCRQRPPLTYNQRRLQQAERGIERQLAELRVLRTAPELAPHDPRRRAYRNRHFTLAAKAARRTRFRQRELFEIARSNRPKAVAGP